MTLFTKLFIFLREKSCPFDHILSYVPKEGSLLDIGCGYGVFARYVKRRNSGQAYVGIDPDCERIRYDTNLFEGKEKTTFFCSTLLEFHSSNPFDIITINDVLYLLPQKVKLQTIRSAYKHVKKGGIVIIKFNPKTISFQYFLTWLQELITVKIVQKTKTGHDGLYFETKHIAMNLLKTAGFHQVTFHNLPTPFPFFHPHGLVRGIK